MKEHVKAARQALMDVPRQEPGEPYYQWHTRHAEALDRAGLLRTGLEQRAVEACEEHVRRYPGSDKGAKDDACAIVSRVGADSLALKQPPRWKRTQDSQGVHFIEKGSRQLYVHQLSEPERDRICAALNACDTETT